MNRIVLKIVFYVEVLVSVALWTATEVIGQMPPYTESPSSTFNPKGTPCEGVTCPWGRRCTLNESSQATCVCGGNCYDNYIPVCGSDNRTHSRYCALTEEACRTNSNLTVLYEGQCIHEGSLCYGVTCPSNRVCVVAGNRAICVCTPECSPYSNPVCGSDNQTYFNDCELRRKSCMANDNITIAFYGKCKQATVCDGFSCSNGRRCAVNERHQPVCVCIDSCPYTMDTVCGSDGRTYGSECELQKEACTSNTNTRVAYKGYCFAGSVCSGHRCPSDRECSVNQFNQPVCVCSKVCPSDNTPICGSDGVTYHNLCDLKRQGCTTGTNITMARTGKCIYNEYCYGVSCTPPNTCVVDAENQTSCGCNKDCGNDYYPVCGSDNKTYDNDCEMKVAFCQANTNITTYYYGVCSEGSNCQGIDCPVGTHCDSENQTEPMCVCDTVCPKTYSPLCGSNNKTYNNSCELQRDACLTNNYIGMMFSRRCDEGPGCNYKNCPDGRTCALDERNQPMCVCSQYCYGSNEVCGTDNKTYSGECFLTVAACLTNKTITVQRNGQCERESCNGVVCSSDRYCDLGPDGRPTCVCNEYCSSYGSGVCGSDNRTYVNLCQLQKQSCLSNSSILWLYDGKCVEASVCDGVSCSPEKRCAIDEQYQPTCVCIDECQNDQAICGSDGQTYYSECEMQKAACLSNRNITLVNRGRCDQGRTCIDINIYCTTGRSCALNETNQPTCVCNTVCSDVTFSPAICGTDGKTYNSSCSLQRQACMTDRIIREDYYGSCRNDSACAAVQCPTRRACKVNSTGQPECVCSTLCKFEYAPVCGSDGKTHSNSCQLNVTACQNNSNITLAYDGDCKTDSACAAVQCPTGAACKVNSTGQPECVCSTVCTFEYAPVCGSDGNTYGNRCQLNVTACQTKTNITLAYDGDCKTDSACAAVQCPTGAACKVNSTGQPECVCSTLCTFEYAPVCGSDGKTYDNRCQLNVTACQSNNITEAHSGECNTAASSNRSIHPGSVILITNFILITVTVLLNCFTF